MGIDILMRICRCCQLGIEDEYHFVLVCPFYDELRNMYLPHCYCHHRNIHKFKSLLCSSNNQLLFYFCKFLFNSYEKRQSFVNIPVNWIMILMYLFTICIYYNVICIWAFGLHAKINFWTLASMVIGRVGNCSALWPNWIIQIRRQDTLISKRNA